MLTEHANNNCTHSINVTNYLAPQQASWHSLTNSRCLAHWGPCENFHILLVFLMSRSCVRPPLSQVQNAGRHATSVLFDMFRGTCDERSVVNLQYHIFAPLEPTRSLALFRIQPSPSGFLSAFCRRTGYITRRDYAVISLPRVRLSAWSASWRDYFLVDLEVGFRELKLLILRSIRKPVQSRRFPSDAVSCLRRAPDLNPVHLVLLVLPQNWRASVRVYNGACHLICFVLTLFGGWEELF
jgi:hypothetical protein